MLFALLCYAAEDDPERTGPAVSPQEWEALTAADAAHPPEPPRPARLVGDHLLEAPSEAVSVLPVDGEVFAVTGPFLQVRACLAGVRLIECEDREHAVEIARSCRMTERFRCVEVRPVRDRRPAPTAGARDWS
jgi:hypothetical protein